MENNNGKSGALPTRQQTSLTVSDRCREIATKAIHDVNKFLPFPISGPEIVSWAADIERLAPDVEVGALIRLMDAFKTGEILWEEKAGITNIFRGLRRVIKTEEGYQILKTGIW